MPHFEVTVMVRSLAKPQLLDALVRSCSQFLDQGAVITKATSLGHRDLPFKRLKNGQKHMTANVMLFDVHMPMESMFNVRHQIVKDDDILQFFYDDLDKPDRNPIKQCSLGEELKPAAYRQSVIELRDTAKQSWWTRRKAYNNAKFAYQKIPKSFKIPNVVP